jgi:hypothetical protein
VLVCFAMNWLETHVYIAAWASPIVTLVGFIVSNAVRPTDRVNWSIMVIYVAFLTSLAAVLTPGMEIGVRAAATGVGSILMGVIVVDAMWKR